MSGQSVAVCPGLAPRVVQCGSPLSSATGKAEIAHYGALARSAVLSVVYVMVMVSQNPGDSDLSE